MRDEKSNKTLRIKANIRASKTKFDQKVVASKVKVKDGLDSRYHSFITVYIPKLTPKHIKPCVMMHVGNNNSQAFFRVSHPDALVDVLQDLIDTLKSNEWLEKWWELEDIAENLMVNNLVLDEMFVDINEWNQALEDTIEWKLISKEEFVSRGDP